MSRTAVIVWKSIGVSVVAILLIGAVVWGYVMSPAAEPCRSMHYEIQDASDRLYLTEEELNKMLQTEDIYPVGRPQNRISLYRIESAVAHHPMVRTAECYITPRFEVKVRLTQRVPLLHVQTVGENYFIDTDRKVLPYRSSIQDNVLRVTGTVGTQFASEQLGDFAEWLQSNRYWRKRIHHLQVQSPHMVYIHLNDPEQPRIVLGDMQGHEQKLAKLRTFLENNEEATQDKHYTEYDIRFEGQVIGRNL